MIDNVITRLFNEAEARSPFRGIQAGDKDTERLRRECEKRLQPASSIALLARDLEAKEKGEKLWILRP